jgi:hypothetical protein
MADSDVQIVNSALRRLGDDPITALTDDSERARLMNAIYSLQRDAVLRAHPWKFAVKRTSLAADSAAPSWGPGKAYTLPPEALRVLTTKAWEDTREPWVVEGRKILTDAGAPLYLKYVARITDPTQYDSMFAETLSARLAAVAAYPITGNRTTADAQWQLYLLALTEAKTFDGLERSPEEIEANTLVEVRW